MKKYLFSIALILLLSIAVHAQQGVPVRNLFGSGPPNANLASVVGTTYIDQSTATPTMYTCTFVTQTATLSQCTWTVDGGGGGGGVTQVTTLPGTCTAGSQYQLPSGAIYSCGPTNVLTPVGSLGPAQATDPQFPSGLRFWHRSMPSETSPCTAPIDWSSNNNTGSGTVGTPGTAIAATGGCLFAGNGAYLTANNANVINVKTISVLIGFQESAAGSSVFNSPILSSMAGNQGVGIIMQACSSSTVCNVASTEVPWVPMGYDGTNGKAPLPAAVINGNVVLTLVMGAGGNGNHLYVNNLEVCGASNTNVAGNTGAYPSTACIGVASSAGINTAAWQCGGLATLVASLAYFNGPIYDCMGYDGALSAADVQKHVTAVTVDATNRGINMALSPTDTGNHLVVTGNSLDGGGASLATYWPQEICPFITPAGTWTCLNLATGGSTALSMNKFQPVYQVPEYRKNTAKNAVANGSATNDCLSFWPTTPPIDQIYTNFSQQINGFNQVGTTQVSGFDLFLSTMMSRTQAVCNSGSCDPCKNAINPIVRQNILSSYRAKGLADWAMNLALGPDGSCVSGGATGKACQDAVHPTEDAEFNIVSPMWLWTINGGYGCWNLSCATTYSAATAVQAITASSESTNTMTYTVAANAPAAGQVAFVTGVTPAGYNTTQGAATDAVSWVRTSAGGTSFTVYNGTTGLGAGSVFGTVTTSLQQSTDGWSKVNGTFNDQLPPCWLFPMNPATGRKELYISNIGVGTVTLLPWGGETITGSTSIATTVTAILQASLISQAAGGCTVVRTQ